jgi:hypothetical protein
MKRKVVLKSLMCKNTILDLFYVVCGVVFGILFCVLEGRINLFDVKHQKALFYSLGGILIFFSVRYD